MKTTCFKREMLFAYANRMLHEREQARVEAHLEVCAACRTAMASYQKLNATLGEWKPAEPSAWFDAHARARIESGAASRAWPAWHMAGWRRWAGVAAIVALAVITSLVALRAFKPNHSPAPVTVATAAHATAPAAAAAEASATPAPSALAPGATGQTATPAESASQEMDLYENLKVLENYDMLANFKVLSELPQASDKSND